MSKRHVLFSALCLICCAGIASADLVGLWTLNEGEGTVTADLTGNGNDGAFQGSPLWVAGQYGWALELDGSSWVDCGNAPQLELTGPMTTIAWVNPGDLSGDRGYIARSGAWAMKSSGGNLRFTTPGVLDHDGGNTPLAIGEWQHVAVTFEPSVSGGAVFYLNGTETDRMNASTLNAGSGPVEIGHNQWGQEYIGQIDEVAVFNHALTAEEILEAMAGLGNVELAQAPSPEDGSDDVVRDDVLAWIPGEFAATHNLYLGTSFEDVNSATVPTAANLDANSFDPGRLDFGQTYYWRVDEVNGTPDKTVFTGKVWSFTVEPYSIQIPSAEITATASSSSNEFSTPDKTIDGSGLDADGNHSIAPESMWFTGAVDLDPWIQYEFDGVQKLDSMKVWNSNSAAEVAIGWSVKDIEIQVSVDGTNWTELYWPVQLSRGPGSPFYNQFDEVSLNGVAAKYVRLNINSNWGGILMSYSLSEVQFFMIPVKARTPDPASDAVDVLPNATVTWRAGREADESTIYVGTDPNEVADGLAPSIAAGTNAADLSALDLELGTTYYWRVDEVNNAEDVSVWAGPVWNFSTVTTLVVDDFESYGNSSPDRPFQTWLDGFGYSADEFFPTGYGGNGTGSGIGHDIWSLSSPHYGLDIMETSNTIAGSGQAMPFYYSNSGGTASQTDRTFAVAQDWTVGGVKTLSIPFFGTTGNTGQLFVTVNNTKVSYDMEAGDIALAAWQVWNIDLASLGINLGSVTKMSIGVDGNGASGMVLIDDIKLYAQAGDLITPVDPGTGSLVSTYHLDGDFTDSTGGLHGTAIGNPIFVSDPARGQVVSLDGASSGADIPYNAALNPEAFTVSLWVNADPAGTGHRSPITSRDDGPARGYIIYANPANTWQFWIGTGEGWSSAQGPAVATGEWTHLTISYADELSRLYVNGFLAGENTNPIGLNTQQPLRIGGGATEGPGNYFFLGMIDEVRIYNSELSAGEALWLSGRDTPIHKPF